MHFKKRLMGRSVAMVAIGLLFASSASALPNYEETFSTDAAGWTNHGRTAAGWDATGGPDGSGAATVDMNYGTFVPPFPGAGPIVFRCETLGAGCSGGNFVGNWSNINLLSIKVKHDAPVPLAFYMRLAVSPAGFPGGLYPYQGAPVAPNTWTQLDWDPNNTAVGNCIDEGPPGSTCPATIANVGYLQFGTDTPAAATGTYNFAFDNVKAVPEPGTAAMLFLGLSGLGMWNRRMSGRH